MSIDIRQYKTRMRRLRDQLKSEGHLEHWKDLSDFFLPQHGKYLTSDNESAADRKSKKGDKILNGTSQECLRIIGAGLQSGSTPPTRPWFTLGVEDPDLTKWGPAARWLRHLRDLCLRVYARSNFYGVNHDMYIQMAAFANAATILDGDLGKVLRCVPLSIGQYALGLDAQYRPDSLYRWFTMTARQLAQKFGREVLPQQVKDALSKTDSRYEDKLFEVRQAIQPKTIKEGLPSDMKYESVYWMDGFTSDEKCMLRRKGYLGIPFIAPRWMVAGTNTYGYGPGMEALPDVKQLQALERKKLARLDKHIDPPMVAPTSMRNKGGTIVPGGITYVDAIQGASNHVFRPAYQTDGSIQDVRVEIDVVEHRIQRMFFNDLFLAVINANRTGDGRERTATEIARMYEEKAQILGPVMERLKSEDHDPLIDRTIQLLFDAGAVPPPPPELQGMELNVEYTGILAQAQRMVGTTAMEQAWGFATNVAGVQAQLGMTPEVLDNFDADRMVSNYAEMVGTDPEIVRDANAVQEIRHQRQQQQQAAAQAQAAQQAVDIVKTADGLSVDGDEALAALMGGS